MLRNRMAFRLEGVGADVTPDTNCTRPGQGGLDQSEAGETSETVTVPSLDLYLGRM